VIVKKQATNMLDYKTEENVIVAMLTENMDKKMKKIVIWHVTLIAIKFVEDLGETASIV
jgi:hypothetical protein